MLPTSSVVSPKLFVPEKTIPDVPMGVYCPYVKIPTPPQALPLVVMFSNVTSDRVARLEAIAAVVVRLDVVR